VSLGFAADNFHKLRDAEIKARLAGMEITDGVHWAEQYMRDGTYKAFHLGKPSKGKWFVRDGELCLDEGKGEPDCREVWISVTRSNSAVLVSRVFSRPNRSAG